MARLQMRNLTILMMLVICGYVDAGILPDYDKNCDYMKIEKVPTREVIAQKYGNVPRILHRIWFGPTVLSKENLASWGVYAKHFGYEYHLWNESHESIYQSIMSEKNFALWKMFMSQRNWWSASDLLRLELINFFGGIYVDCDFYVPCIDGNMVDFFDLINDHELTLMTEHAARNIGSEVAIFVSNSLICAPPGHRVLKHCVDNIYENCAHWHSKVGNFSAMYVTGPFFLNKALNGPYYVLPVTFLSDLGMH